MSAPTDSESLKMFHAPDEMAAQINNHINNHPLAQALRADPAWIESRPHLRYSEVHKRHSLTAGTLLVPGCFAVPPVVFCSDQELVSIAYVGTDMCGHVGIVHGGLLATMLDEGLARCAFNSLPNHVGVTANLNINYRKPAPAGSYLTLRAETTKVEGRKVWVKGRIELLGQDENPGQTLVEAEGLYVEPKYVKVNLKEQSLGLRLSNCFRQCLKYSNHPHGKREPSIHGEGYSVLRSGPAYRREYQYREDLRLSSTTSVQRLSPVAR